MPRYLYIFTYQTPEQQAAALGREFSDESCEALFIEAEAADKALEWGRQVSEKHVSRLFGSWDVSWAARHFAHWIESEPEQEFPLEVLERLPVVHYGEYPKP